MKLTLERLNTLLFFFLISTSSIVLIEPSPSDLAAFIGLVILLIVYSDNLFRPVGPCLLFDRFKVKDLENDKTLLGSVFDSETSSLVRWGLVPIILSLIFLFLSLISSMLSVDHAESIEYLFKTFILYMHFFFVYAFVFIVGEKEVLYNVLKFSLVITCLLCFVVVISALFPSNPYLDLLYAHSNYIRIKALFKDPNVLAPYAVFSFFLLAAFVKSYLGKLFLYFLSLIIVVLTIF